MESKLTQKQEVFTLALFEGKSQIDAYRVAFGQGNMSDKTLYEKGCVLANTDKIQARLKELRTATAEKLIWDKARAMKELEELAIMGKKYAIRENVNGDKFVHAQTLTATISAIAELNKVAGVHAPSKTESKVILNSGGLNETLETLKKARE